MENNKDKKAEETKTAETKTNASENEVSKELELSDGRKAKVLKTLGKHVMQAHAQVGKNAEEKLLPTMIAMRTVIDGKKIVIEDLENMPAKDYLMLMGEFAEKNF